MPRLPSHRNRSVDAHQFSMIPRADIPRSSFLAEHTHKTTFDAGYLIPVYCDEVLPGDVHQCQATMFARLTTPIYPIMDNLHLDSFFFFVPNRLVWDNWNRFMGEQIDPGASTDFLVPQINGRVDGFFTGSIYDYLGLPCEGQTAVGEAISITALPLRAYNLIYNEWFRDQNMVDRVSVERGDGPDGYTLYNLLRRGKRHDYFTSCLPWPQKGDAVSLPLGGLAPVRGIGVDAASPGVLGTGITPKDTQATYGSGDWSVLYRTDDVRFLMEASGEPGSSAPAVYADLADATASTINQLRQAFQLQRLLERDARGGTRYTEIVRAHFGVNSPDSRLQRPEYIGGGQSLVNVSPIAQSSATGLSGGSAPLGTLAAVGAAVSQHGFQYSATEHGYIIGLINVRADLTYQQGLERMWTRSTKYDFYWPALAHLGEQAVLRQEIYSTGDDDDDVVVFGYQERWAEYRYARSRITGIFNSRAADTLDAWHLAQNFLTAPVLGDTFIAETPPMDRVLAVQDEPDFLADMLFSVRKTRAMPLYSVPGMMDHF